MFRSIPTTYQTEIESALSLSYFYRTRIKFRNEETIKLKKKNYNRV